MDMLQFMLCFECTLTMQLEKAFVQRFRFLSQNAYDKYDTAIVRFILQFGYVAISPIIVGLQSNILYHVRANFVPSNAKCQSRISCLFQDAVYFFQTHLLYILVLYNSVAFRIFRWTEISISASFLGTTSNVWCFFPYSCWIYSRNICRRKLITLIPWYKVWMSLSA